MANIDVVQLRNQLKIDEGTILHAYRDSRGFLTIGSGILIDEREGGGITNGENDFLLDNRITKAINDMDDRIPWIVTKSDGVQRAVANMVYNMGIEKVLRFKEMLAALKADNYKEAAAQALDSPWATEVGDRATRIAALLSAG
jgi:lysozyme